MYMQSLPSHTYKEVEALHSDYTTTTTTNHNMYHLYYTVIVVIT